MAKSLSAISRKRLSEKETLRAMGAAREVDDRTCVLMISALLEHGMERLLLHHMAPMSKAERHNLFFGQGPLATASELAS